jgi:hypothetical protein
MSTDLDILSFMTDRDEYFKYRDVIKRGLCSKEAWTLITDYGEYFSTYPNKTEIDSDFLFWFKVTRHPGFKAEVHDVYDRIIFNVLGTKRPDSKSFLEQLDALRFRRLIEASSDGLNSGSISADDVVTQVSTFTWASRCKTDAAEELNLVTLSNNQRTDDGFYWRCEDLNQAIGPVRKGDVIIIGKRPEIGGTSFICSELSYMVEQMDKDGTAILFNNEEAKDKLYSRMCSAALNVDYRTMMGSAEHYDQQYQDWLDGRTWHLEHDTTMTLGSLHKLIADKKPSIIGINVLLKIGGTGKLEDHDKYQLLGEELRRLSISSAPILAVVQADPTAEGVRYIPQDRIYKSKTALQGEADVLIMIGYDEDGPSNSRYIHVAKNKIPPAPCCNLSLKHSKSEVQFDIATGRFTSMNYKGNSRP